MNPDHPDRAKSEPAPASTTKPVNDARHYAGLAKSYVTFLQVALREDLSEPHAADLVRGSYEDVCETLLDAQRQAANAEPEMAEVIAELQRLKDEYRELIN